LPTAKQPLVRLMPLAKVEVAVEEAFNPPVKIKLPVTVEEAWEINPPARVDKLATLKVEEADNGPLMFKLAETVEEAWEINPPVKVERPVIFKVPVAVKFAKVRFPENKALP